MFSAPTDCEIRCYRRWGMLKDKDLVSPVTTVQPVLPASMIFVSFEGLKISTGNRSLAFLQLSCIRGAVHFFWPDAHPKANAPDL